MPHPVELELGDEPMMNTSGTYHKHRAAAVYPQEPPGQ